MILHVLQSKARGTHPDVSSRPSRDRCLQTWCELAAGQVSHIEAFLPPCHTESIAWSRCCSFQGSMRTHHLRSHWLILSHPHTNKSFNLNLNMAKGKWNLKEVFARCLLLSRLISKYVCLDPDRFIVSGSSSSHHQEFPHLRGCQALHPRGLSLAL